MNTTEGSFTRTMLTSSFFVFGFPSPLQFHTKRFIVSGMADEQPPPISKIKCHPLEKPIAFYWVTLR